MSSQTISFHHSKKLPRLIVSDLDGTLLNQNHAISRRSIEALLYAQQKGIQFMVATGRPPRSVHDLFSGQITPNAVLCSNGALSFDPKARVVSNLTFVDHQKSLAMVRDLAANIASSPVVSSNGIPPSERAGFSCEVVYVEGVTAEGEPIYSNDTYFVCDRIWQLEQLHLVPGEFTPVDGMLEFLESLQHPNSTRRGGIVKLLALDRARTASEVYESLSTNIHESLSIVYSTPHFLEIAAMGMHKAVGLEKYCKANGIHVDDVVAFGDFLNDIEMLEFAGLGLCMGNGHEDVKKVADRVIGTNVEDGVAREIESWFDLNITIIEE
ncbi:UNVERIFIED_CONTAM: hypothetical protein HDU68_003541 [Siphonaria sp. JEL0065]|nr:hypothetical protein HDU68_003541 [Siphonaria sp. JEL0065]